MASNYSPDQDMEDTLRRHFASEADDLRAPTNLWDSLEDRLEPHPAPNPVTRIRRKILAAAKQNWLPVMVTGGAVAVAASAVLVAGNVGQGLQETEVVEKTVVVTEVREVIKEVPVETVVTKEVIKEVPVETVVTREVIKEVPVEAVVEKVVTQEVIKEVVKEVEVIREVPVERVVEKVVEVEKVVTQPRAEAMMPAPTAATTAAPPAAAEAAPALTVRPADTTFQDYGRQPFVATVDDAVSTFSLDTDRTSYHLALTWAQQGYDVEPDSVRAEEWINAFDYQYAQPADAWGFAITSDLVAHPLDERQHLVRIGFQAAEVADDRPLNVTLVLDASGSMGDGNRVDIARAAAEAIRRSLRPQDRVAVVHFTTDVIHHLTVEHSGPDDYSVESSIAQLAPHGSTNVQAGLNLGVQLAHQARLERPEANNYVILMSDGVANVDATNPFAILESAYDRNADNPLRLITIGVGINNYNDVLLEQLAQHGNGWYRYLNDAAQARATFSRASWLALSTPFADQTRAQVTWDPDVVKSWRIIGYENRVTSDASFAEDRKEFAELPSGAATTVFYEVELQDGVRGGDDLKLGRVELRWVVPETGQSRSQQVEVTGRSNLSFGSYEADPLLRLGGIVALAADRYSSLPRGADDGTAGVSTDLAILQEELRALAGPLGGLDAYRDFSFVLERMAERAYTQAPPEAPSGYSR
ncbi:MAG: von Willebrand factor type A domain-containing protein [Chloroflexi bacterium]|nr:von Willebrand factor type A domain-containing protein [Chloroflexota bacterium]